MLDDLLALLRREMICLENLLAYVPSLYKEQTKMLKLRFATIFDRRKGKLINKVGFHVVDTYMVRSKENLGHLVCVFVGERNLLKLRGRGQGLLNLSGKISRVLAPQSTDRPFLAIPRRTPHLLKI